MITTAWSESGSPDRPGEDWHGIADHVQAAPVVVLDGGTARTDTGCIHGVAWYAQQLGAELLRLLQNPEAGLVEILAGGIEVVAEQHRDTCNLDHPGTPSAAVAMVRPTTIPGRWQYAVLGDVTIVFETPTGPQAIADDRISQSAATERVEADRWPIGSPEKDAAMVAMKHAELAERNRTYWIAAADPTAAKHALTGAVDKVNRLAVLTDGAARARVWGLMTWSEMFNVLALEGPSRVIQYVRNAETTDPEGRRWPRNKRSDDATVVFVGPPGY